MSLLCCVEKCVTRQRVISPNILEYANEKRGKGTFDNIIIEVGSETIAANRMILSCCSRFFEGMFDLELKEKYQNPVQVNGVDGKAVKALIDFMYCGEVKINNENVMELLAACDYLLLDEVKQFCFEFLESVLSSDNWFVVLNAAKLYQNEDIESHVYEYMSKTLNEVMQTHEFKSLSKDDLVGHFSKLNRSYFTEALIFEGIVIWSKHDLVNRKHDFLLLFEELVIIDNIPTELLKSRVMKEELVKNDTQCLLLVNNFTMRKILRLESGNMCATKLISFGGTRTPKAGFEIYETISEPHQNRFDLPFEVDCHVSLKLNNFVYCIGGRTFDGHGRRVPTCKVWKTDKLDMTDEISRWTEVALLNHKRYLMGGAVFQESLVVAGGYNSIVPNLNSVEFYHSATNQWRIASSLQQARSGCALVTCDDYLYALGGWCAETCMPSVERLGDLTEKWEFA